MSNYTLMNNIQGDGQKHLEIQQQEFEDRVQKIKEMCVATTILHITRTLMPEDKQLVKSYCDKVLFRAHQLKTMADNGAHSLEDYDGLPNLADLHQRIDQHKVMSLSNLRFDESGRQFLIQLYEVAKDGMVTPSVVEYYQKIVEFVIQ